ncbi:MAG TPA: PQQ-binding-like beta-propeller repeat protein [Thermoflexus sp.]|nr:PQQ-binding-like beta-propeller repeat protein [Thermoflexus sp.]
MSHRIRVSILILMLSLCKAQPSATSQALSTMETPIGSSSALSLLSASPLASTVESPTIPASPAEVSLTAHYRLYLPIVFYHLPITPDEWTQHAHDAQRTSYTNQVVPPPWRWKWVWNGPNANGGISSGKFGLPRNVQPVTGGGRVYIAAGSRGVFALAENDLNGDTFADVLWNTTNVGTVNSTVAYDSDTQSVFVVSTNGTLYKLNAATGTIIGQFASGASSTLPLPPAVISDRVFFSMGNHVYAIRKTDMALIWSYNAGSQVTTPPAYSPSRNRVVVGTDDLFVHAINNTNGTQAWRVKPTVRTGPYDRRGQDSLVRIEYANGWPVISESAGLVLIRLRLDYDALYYLMFPYPSTNSAIRSFLASHPEWQNLFAVDLDDGSVPFICNIIYHAWGDSTWPMGPQPALKQLPNGKQVVWMPIRGGLLEMTPGNYTDSHFGEMVLDNSTVPGLQAGDIRWMNNDSPEFGTRFPSDEPPNPTIAGNYLFGGHWEAGLAREIIDRSDSRGSFENPILTRALPHLVTSQDDPECPFNNKTHYCPNRLVNTRIWPAGFYIYYGQGPVYDQYWTEYATWVVSNQTIYFVSGDGALVALEHGDPLSASGTSEPVAERPLIPGSPPIHGVADRHGIPVVPYTEARAYAGQTAIVEGIVRFVFNNGKAVYLGFQNPHQGAFKVRILRADWKTFPLPPERLYPTGIRIRVHGLIEWYQGDPQIIVRDPSQIQILEPWWWTDLTLSLRNPGIWLLGGRTTH